LNKALPSCFQSLKAVKLLKMFIFLPILNQQIITSVAAFKNFKNKLNEQ
jgi:hypothetical protein